MNTTPRGLNRVVLAVVGLLAFAAGAAGLALVTLPAVASWWAAAAPRVGEAVDGARTRTTLDGQDDTWLWLALAAVLLLLIVLLVLWIMAQGRGRTGIFVSTEGARTPAAGGPADGGGETAGTVTITAAAAEQALKAALLERPDLAAASVSTWEVRGVPGLRVRVSPRKGVPAYAVAADIARLIEALDRVIGYRTPVLVSIRSGARVRFSRADRVA